jgi:hypothetical protein
MEFKINYLVNICSSIQIYKGTNAPKNVFIDYILLIVAINVFVVVVFALYSLCVVCPSLFV